MKNIFLALFLALMTTSCLAQQNKATYQLSSHILDVSRGLPAAGVTIKLEKWDQGSKSWHFAEEKITDPNGRVPDFLKSGKNNLGIYKLTYFTADYFKKMKTESFYPWVEVVFEITDTTHYHVPITLSAYGYSTYRGN